MSGAQIKEEVGFYRRPPLLEDTSIRGPLRIPVEGALDTLQQRHAIEADYTWYRYSKFAAPFLCWMLLLAVAILALTFWQQVGGMNPRGLTSRTVPDHEDGIWEDITGVPHLLVTEAETDADNEGGLPKGLRNVRIATVFIGTVFVVLILAVFGCKPMPKQRAVYHTALAVLLLVPCVLAWISFGWGIDTLQNATQCPPKAVQAVTFEKCLSRKGYAIAAAALSAGVALMCMVCAYLLLLYTQQGDFRLLRTGWRMQERDMEEERPAQKDPNHNRKLLIRQTRVQCMLIALVFLLLLLIALTAIIIVLHEDRHVDYFRGPGYMNHGSTSSANSNSMLRRSGWPERNTKLRYAVAAITILTILLNCIPFTHRAIAYVFAVFYSIACILCIVTFFFDVHELGEADNITCPTGYKCVKSPYIATACLEFLLFLSLLFYVCYEIVAKCFTKSRHSHRGYAPHELGKVEAFLDSQRPVRDELQGDVVLARDFVYSRAGAEPMEAPLPVAPVVQAPVATYVEQPIAAPVVQYVEQAPVATYVEQAPMATYVEQAPMATYVEQAPVATYIQQPAATYVQPAATYVNV